MFKNARPEPFFIADNFALDLLNSVGSPWGTRIEWLGDGRDLLAWLEQAGLVPADVLMRFQEKTPPEELDEITAQVRELREWFREFVAPRAGHRLEPTALTDLDRINRLLAGDEAYRQIEPQAAASPDAGGASLQWRRYRRWRSPEDLLLPMAEAMGELICNVDFERVRNCEGPTCTMWFRDVSKNHTRRWCSMAVCGNRAKAAAHRAKKREASSG